MNLIDLNTNLLTYIACHFTDPQDFYHFGSLCKKTQKIKETILNREGFPGFKELIEKKKHMKSRINTLGLVSESGEILKKGEISVAYQEHIDTNTTFNKAYLSFQGQYEKLFNNYIYETKKVLILNNTYNFLLQNDLKEEHWIIMKKQTLEGIQALQERNAAVQKLHIFQQELHKYVTQWEGAQPKTGPFVDVCDQIQPAFEKAISEYFKKLNK